MWKSGRAFCSPENHHATHNPAICFMPLISVIHGYQTAMVTPRSFIKGSCARLAGAAALLPRLRIAQAPS